MNIKKLNYFKEFPLSLSLNKVELKLFSKKEIIENKRIEKDKLIQQYLDDLFAEISPMRTNKMGKSSKIIWVMWQQGIENAPNIVKNCIQSIENNKSEAKVIHITENNLYEYIEFPDYIVEKYHSGLITRTHFSDLVRIKLLAKYGGLWLDSTVFLSKPILNDIFEYRFFSVKGAVHPDNLLPFLASRWTAFVMGG